MHKPVFVSRRTFVAAAATAGGVGAAQRQGSQPRSARAARTVRLSARPGEFSFDTGSAAVLVIDMQNDFGSKGGMMDLAGIDISQIQKAVGPTARVLSSARRAALPVVYLKMGYKADLSDLGDADSPNRVRHLAFGVGKTVRAPNGRESRVLIRDTWNTDIVPELTPAPGDSVLYKTRFSGFYRTDLDQVLKRRGVTSLIVTGCTTSVCVESTIRDAMFRDYRCVLLSDCTAEPVGMKLPRTNHEASLLLIETLLGWVSRSDDLVAALDS